MKVVSIIGVGLIGGSLGQALRRVKRSGRRAYRVRGWGRSRRSLASAKRLGAVDEFTTNLPQAVSDADLIVLCVPVDKIAALGKIVGRSMRPGAILTDVGSVKWEIVRSLRNPRFVGGHPIAGSEKAGVENAQPRLFKGATTVLTRDGAGSGALEAVRRLWRDAGARVIITTASAHDRILALTSHLPHLLAYALFSLARDQRIARSFVGPSFNAATRIAASDPNLWTAIFMLNRPDLARQADQFLRTCRSLLRLPAPRLRRRLAALAEAKRAF